MTVRAIAAAVLVALAVAGCGAESQPDPQASPPVAPTSATTAPAEPPVPPELLVENPKTASGIPPCDLLTDEQLVELGLLPESGEPDSIIEYDGCSWQIADDRLNLAGAGINVGVTLADLYSAPERFERFEPVPDIAGHPAVRADPFGGKGCPLVVSLGGDQLLATLGNIANRPVPDPCALPRRMAEMILSNLPPAT